MSNDQPAGGGVQSVDRAVTVMENLAPRGTGMSEVATHLGVHESTAFRLELARN